MVDTQCSEKEPPPYSAVDMAVGNWQQDQNPEHKLKHLREVRGAALHGLRYLHQHVLRSCVSREAELKKRGRGRPVKSLKPDAEPLKPEEIKERIQLFLGSCTKALVEAIKPPTLPAESAVGALYQNELDCLRVIMQVAELLEDGKLSRATFMIYDMPAIMGRT